MRVAFVGKGGSGKSTLSASLAKYVSNQSTKPVAVFDADLNIHIPELFGYGDIFVEKHLSYPKNSEVIKKWLIGDNNISNLGAFRKSTPPTNKSNLIRLETLKDTPLGMFGLHQNNLSLFAVGTYQEDEIGASCYHNNLAIFENILTHTDDKNGYIIADMVAGVDSFAGTLHAQFDLTCFVVEPTIRSVEVYKKYLKLAIEAGIDKSVLVIGNKIRNNKDQEFISKHISEEKIIGCFFDDEHIRDIDQLGGVLDVFKLDENNQKLLEKIFKTLNSLPDNRNLRLKKIWDLHRKYINQTFIKDRFGDLSSQIDTNFLFENEHKN